MTANQNYSEVTPTIPKARGKAEASTEEIHTPSQQPGSKDPLLTEAHEAGELTKCSSVEGWITKMWYTDMMEFYSAVKQ